MNDPKQVAQAIEQAALENNTTVYALLKVCEMPRNTVTNMKNGSMPAADKLARIAAELNVPTDYLLGLTDIPQRGSVALTPLQIKLGTLTEIELAKVESYIDRILDETAEAAKVNAIETA